jgi:hypothetical protein
VNPVAGSGGQDLDPSGFSLAVDPRVAEVFRKLGLQCFDCVAAEKETLRIGALYHEKDLQTILDELNRHGFSQPKKAE